MGVSCISFGPKELAISNRSSNNGGGCSSCVPLEPHKLAILMLWFACAVVSNWLVLAIVHDLVDWQPMADPVFSLFVQQQWAYTVGDWCVSASFATLCLLLIFHQQRFLIFRRLLFILALLNTLRSLAILFTRLPSSYDDNFEKCRPKVNGSERNAWLLLNRTMEQAIRLGLQDSSQKMLCGDQFFSGHTAMMTISALSVQYYVPVRWQPISYFPKLFALLGIPCLVFSRTHYCCDVLVGYFTSAIVFVLYHAICEIESRDSREESLIHQTFLIARVVHWFERHMPHGRPENQFQIPLIATVRKWRWRKQKGHGRESSAETVTSNVFFIVAK